LFNLPVAGFKRTHLGVLEFYYSGQPIRCWMYTYTDTYIYWS